jgi:hypothetical protein
LLGQIFRQREGHLSRCHTPILPYKSLALLQPQALAPPRPRRQGEPYFSAPPGSSFADF